MRGWPAALAGLLDAERERWALWLPVGVGVGVIGYFGLTAEPPWWLGVAVLTAIIGAAGLTALAVPSKRGAGLAGALVLGSLAAGFAVAQARTAWVAAPVLERKIGPVGLRGRVAGIERLPKGLRLVLEAPRIDGLDPDRTPARVRLRLSAGQGAAVEIGAWVELRAVLRPPSPPAAPGAFDFQRHAYFLRLGGVGFAVAAARRVAPPRELRATAFGSWRLALAGLRIDTADRIRSALDGPAGAVAAALMTGDRRAIPKHVLADMRDSGLAHLLAISGLHIGLVAGILFFGLRAALALVPKLALHYPIKKWAAAAALVGAFGYVLISGATVPTQRAFLMVCVVLLAVMVDRTAISMRLVAWAALIVLVMAPDSLLGPSFQMSFAAVIALVAAYEVLRGRFSAWRAEAGILRRAGLYLAGVGVTTIVATAATAPFAVYHFNRFAEYGLAANLAAVPLTALWIMPWAMAAFCLMPAGLETLALTPMGWGIEAVIGIARTVAGWPGSVRLVPAMPAAGLGLVAIGVLWLCLWQGRW
ncbi:MAG: ComEC/Rec2 family competence protein, partial [Alphaproteobacteria bacterium]